MRWLSNPSGLGPGGREAGRRRAATSWGGLALLAAALAAAAALLAPASAEASRYLPHALEPVTAPAASLEDLAGAAEHSSLPVLTTADRLDLVDLAVGARLESQRLRLLAGVPAVALEYDAVGSPTTLTPNWRRAVENHTNPNYDDPVHSGQNLLFQGLWTDPITGLSYARARWYDARNASWLSEDPAGPVDSPNLYAGFRLNPAIYTDPLGLESGAAFASMWQKDTLAGQQPGGPNPLLSSKPAAAAGGVVGGSLLAGAAIALGAALTMTGVLSPAGGALILAGGILGGATVATGSAIENEADRYMAGQPPARVRSATVGVLETLGPAGVAEGLMCKDLATGLPLQEGPGGECNARMFSGSAATTQTAIAGALTVGALSTGPKWTVPTEIPSIRGGDFARWFNSLTPEQLEQVWSNPALRNTIEGRLRSPGGLHEWHLVSRAPTFKRWGVTAERIAELRTAIREVRFVDPAGAHGGKGSTLAHNELLGLIDSSPDYQTFVARLQQWAATRLQGGAAALPPGLRPHG